MDAYVPAWLVNIIVQEAVSQTTARYSLILGIVLAGVVLASGLAALCVWLFRRKK